MLNRSTNGNRSSGELLEEAGIELRRTSEGNHKTKCPKCFHTKTKTRTFDLSVLIDERGIVWNCHRCGWKGHSGDLAQWFEEERGIDPVVPKKVRRLRYNI